MTLLPLLETFPTSMLPAVSVTASVRVDFSSSISPSAPRSAPANLSGTTFSGGSIEVSSGVLRIPGDVRTLDGQLLTGTDGIRDDSGGNALAQLSAIGTSGSLRLLSGTLTVTGDLTNSGSIALGGGNREYGETGGTLAFRTPSLATGPDTMPPWEPMAPPASI